MKALAGYGQWGYAWVTAGREIENYLSGDAVAHVVQVDEVRDPGDFEKFKDYLNELEQSRGDAFSESKVEFAAEVIPHIRQDGAKARLDLDKRLSEIVDLLRKWNGIEINQ